MMIAGVLMLCYLAGATPFGFLVARAKGIDIRQFGSGNIGATNVKRALGWGYGIFVFVMDFLKGFLPVFAVRLSPERLGDSAAVLYDLPVACAFLAVLGHVFPVWLGFRGGKAGATGLGAGAVLCWQAMLAAAATWCLVVAMTRYVSLGTILGSVAYVLIYLLLAAVEASPFDRAHRAMTIFCILVSALVILRHRSNIERLLAGRESKV